MDEEAVYRALQDEATDREAAEPDDWEVVPAPQATGGSDDRAKRQLRSVLSVRFAPEELDQIKKAADRDGLTVSAFVRAAAIELAGSAISYKTAFIGTGNFSQFVFSTNQHVGKTASDFQLRPQDEGLVGRP